MNDLNLKVERTIKAAPEDVFNAWLNPEMLRQFMMPAAGMSVPKASNDPQAGGRFEIVMLAEENEIPHAGTYREISPHDRIVFTCPRRHEPRCAGLKRLCLSHRPQE
jgi:uncharacterized protein YndB with AHSA1/START domain